MYYSLDMKKLLSHNLYGDDKKTAGVFRNAIVMTHVHSTDPNTSAKILATHAMHHMALGFDIYLLYTCSLDLADAIMSNNVTAKLVDQGVMQIISMAALQFPTYDDNRADVSHPFHQSYDAKKLVTYNHAALTLWGELYHLAVLDVDEYFSTHPQNTSVNSSRHNSHIIMSSRVGVVCEKCALAGQTEMAYFSQHWNASRPTAILEAFNKIASFSSDPKSVVWPDRVGQVWLHKPFSLSGSKTVSNTDHSYGHLHAHPCVNVVHFYNLNSV